MGCAFGPRRAICVDAAQVTTPGEGPLPAAELAQFETLDLIYRSLCALLYNYVPTSGHPGGSISSGRFVAGILFDGLDYDLADPDREDADILSYAAGHKAMGLYAMWALRDEIAQGPHRIQAHRLVAGGVRQDVGVLAVGIGEVVVEAVEQDPGHEASRRDRAARMPRGRHVVVE